jgi:hypothetical protein
VTVIVVIDPRDGLSNQRELVRFCAGCTNSGWYSYQTRCCGQSMLESMELLCLTAIEIERCIRKRRILFAWKRWVGFHEPLVEQVILNNRRGQFNLPYFRNRCFKCQCSLVVFCCLKTERFSFARRCASMYYIFRARTVRDHHKVARWCNAAEDFRSP